MPSLALACRLSAASVPQIPARVRSILRKYGATMLLPGPSGVAQYGYAPGNYVESTGQTLAPVDSAVGFVADAAGTLGPELANGFNSGWTGTGWTFSGGVASASAATNPATRLATIAAGKTYRVTLRCNSFTSGGYKLLYEGGASLFGDKSASGEFTANLTSTTTGGVYIWCNSALTASFDKFEIKEITGIHATQATTQYKPSVRRGLVNLLTYSNDFSNGAWVKPSVTITSGNIFATTTDATEHILSGSVSSATNSTYTAVVKVKKGAQDWVCLSLFDQGSIGTRRYFNVATGAVGSSDNFNGGADGIAPYTIDAGSGYYYVVLVRAARPESTSLTLRVIPASADLTRVYAAQNTTDSQVSVEAIGIFQGTLTAQQIIDAGGIPVTTSAPASSTRGSNYWQFDGTDDRLSLSAVPFQTQDVSFAITAFNPTVSNADARRLWDFSGNGAEIYLTFAHGNLQFSSYGGSGSAATATATGAVVANTPRIATCVNTGTSRSLRVDGAVTGSSATAVSASTANVATLGNRAAGDRAFSGHKHLQIFGKGAITDNELLTLEKFVAKLQGRTL